MTTHGSPSSSASRAVSDGEPVVVGQEVVRQLEEEPGPAPRRPRTPNSAAYRSATARAPSRSPARSRRASSPSRHPLSATSPSACSASSAWVNTGTAFDPARFARDTIRHRLRQPVASLASSTRCGPRCPSPIPRWSSFTTRRCPGSRVRSGRGRAGEPSEAAAPARRSRRRAPARPPRPPRRHHEPARVRRRRVQQLHLDPDHRVQPRGLRRGREPDRPVQPLVVRDGEPGETELDGPRDQVVGRGGPVEEREVRVAVQLGVGRNGHGGLRGADGDYRTDVRLT